ncbi:hypothetical protein FB451DRAFT_1183422 [Mycena latifolia]|nr:hypothetical protein FB451DRAFT_1183422 [Mycena latifolia]
MLDSIDAIWGEFCWISHVAGGDIQMSIILPAVLGAFNLCFSIYAASAAFKSRTEAEYNMLLACVVTTGFVNMVAAYLRHNIDDDWFGWAFTVSLMLDSLLNISTAYRIVRAYQRDLLTLPQYLPVAEEAPKDYVWVDEKRGMEY